MKLKGLLTIQLITFTVFLPFFSVKAGEGKLLYCSMGDVSDCASFLAGGGNVVCSADEILPLIDKTEWMEIDKARDVFLNIKTYVEIFKASFKGKSYRCSKISKILYPDNYEKRDRAGRICRDFRKKGFISFMNIEKYNSCLHDSKFSKNKCRLLATTENFEWEFPTGSRLYIHGIPKSERNRCLPKIFEELIEVIDTALKGDKDSSLPRIVAFGSSDFNCTMAFKSACNTTVTLDFRSLCYR